MANETAKDQRLIRYLVGQLSEAERTDVEDRYFADDALFEYLSAIETELIDAYIRAELSPANRAHFEQRFLGSPRPRARIGLARRLHERAVMWAGTAATPASLAAGTMTATATSGTGSSAARPV